MADFVTLSCPSCGGKLQITNDLDRFACGFCGLEHVVRRGGGVVSLSPVVEGLKQVQVGVDKTASELAIPRLQAEIADLELALNDIENRYFWSYRYQERPKRMSHKEVISMMKTDLARLSSGLGARLVKRRAGELREAVAQVEARTALVEDKRAQLERHAKIVKA